MCIGYERDRPWRSSHDASSWVGPGPLPKNGVCSAPSPMKIRACFSSYGKAVPSRSFSWTPRSLDTTKWKMIKTVWKIARKIPWSFADTRDVFVNYFSYWLGDDSSSQFSDPKINLDIQWFLHSSKNFDDFPLREALTRVFHHQAVERALWFRNLRKVTKPDGSPWRFPSKMGGFRWRMMEVPLFRCKRCNNTGMEHGWKKLVHQRDPNLGEMPLRTLLGLNPLLLGWNPTLFMEKNNV